jgi:hypothetical protein
MMKIDSISSDHEFNGVISSIKNFHRMNPKQSNNFKLLLIDADNCSETNLVQESYT